MKSSWCGLTILALACSCSDSRAQEASPSIPADWPETRIAETPASPPASPYFQPFSRADYLRQVGLSLLLVVDAKQTLDIRARGFREHNPLLRHASPGQVRSYFLGAIVGSALLAYAMPLEYRRTFQYSAIALEVAVTANNKRIGVRGNF